MALDDLAISAIRMYQKHLSPAIAKLGIGKCKYEPSCSNYALQAIEKYGVFKGTMKGAYRILRCNPFSKGGHDPLE